MARTQGRLGEVAAEVLTDFPERFAVRLRLYALDARGQRRELRLDGFRPHQGRLLLKFAGVDSISAAEELVGCEIQIPRSERAEPEPGSSYVGDLVGCAVVVSGAADKGAARDLGTVAEVQFGAGEAPLLVVRRGEREYLIPFAQEYLRTVDVKAKRLEMLLPEGMLELDAPLTKEEKEAQKRTRSG